VSSDLFDRWKNAAGRLNFLRWSFHEVTRMARGSFNYPPTVRGCELLGRAYGMAIEAYDAHELADRNLKRSLR
jgi:hypothetical protein